MANVDTFGAKEANSDSDTIVHVEDPLDQLNTALDRSKRDDEPLAGDRPCVYCGYNLRGLAPNMQCPECGQSIGDSRYGDRLAYADPAWLRQLRSGLLWMTLAAGGYIPANILGVFALSEMRGQLPGYIFLAIQIVFSVMLCFGAFRLTTPEPRRVDIEDPVTLRRATRVSSIVAALSVSTFLMLVVARVGDLDIDDGFLRIIEGFLISVPIMLSCLFSYLIGIARRIPDMGLAKATSFVRAGLVLFSVTAAVSYYVKIEYVAGLTGMLAICFALSGLVLVWIYWQALTDPSMRARKR